LAITSVTLPALAVSAFLENARPFWSCAAIAIAVLELLELPEEEPAVADAVEEELDVCDWVFVEEELPPP
jgi:hypothetical protein